MQNLDRNFYSALVAPRVSDEEYRRQMAGRLERKECPRCDGMGFLRASREPSRGDLIPCECKAVGMQQARTVYSGLSQQMPSQTFGNFVPDTETGEAYRLALEFAENPTEYHIFTIRGGVGTGKTHLLQAIGWASLDAGRQPKFISVASWLDKLRGTFDDDSPVSFSALYRPLEATQMLLLDDIGAERMTNWCQEQLYKIVNHRYQEGLPMAVSMNLDAAKAVDIYGERTTDRLLDTGSGRVRVVNTGSKSYRTGRERCLIGELKYRTGECGLTC